MCFKMRLLHSKLTGVVVPIRDSSQDQIDLLENYQVGILDRI